VVVPHPTPLHPQASVRTPARPLGGQPVRSSYKSALMAVLGGTLAAKTVPPPGAVHYLPPVADREAFAAVAGAALRPPQAAAAKTPPIPVVAQPPVNNVLDLTPWVLGGGAGVAAVVGLGVVLRSRGGKVRVIDVPPGEAPDWVRQAWIGVELPTRHKEPRAVPVYEIRSGESAGEWVGYAVDGRAAVRAVAAVSPEAADWWRANLPAVTTPGYQLVFPADVCERVG
jgi:hypothetical protein